MANLEVSNLYHFSTTHKLVTASSLIGRNIKKYRQQAGISQDTLSKKAALAFHTIAKIESGYTSNPKIKTLQKISNALSVSLDTLLKQHNG